MKAKKLLAAVMAFAIVFGTFGAVSEGTAVKLGAVSVSADDGVDGDIKYSYEYGTLYITGCTETAEDVVIPGSLNIDGKQVNVYGVKENAFLGNTKIKTLKIDPSIRNIGQNAFKDCTSLKSVEFVNTDSLLTIWVNDMAFAGCTSLESVVFPEKVSDSTSYFSLQSFVFLDCPALKSVTVPEYIYLYNYAPVFGYESTDKDSEPEFTYIGEGEIETNLKKTDGFVMKCYLHTSAAVNAYICELEAQLINAPAEASALTEAVNKSSKDNPNYDVKMSAQSINADRVNNLGGYLDAVNEYYFDGENKAGGMSMAAVHTISDINTGKTVFEHTTAYPYRLYDPVYSDGVFSLNCYGAAYQMQECADTDSLFDKETHCLKEDKKSAVKNGLEMQASLPLYYGKDGKALFEHEYLAGEAMLNGYAYVGAKSGVGTVGIMDKTGKTVLELPSTFNRAGRGRYGTDYLYNYSYTSYYSTIEGAYGQGLIPFSSQYKHEGKTIFDAPCEQEDFDWAVNELEQRVEGSDTCGYIDLEGNIVIPQSFMRAGEFTEDGLAWVCKGSVSSQDKYYGYIDTKGEAVIPFEYDDAFSFDSGYAVVKKNGRFGMIDSKNAEVIPFEYDDSKGQKEGFMTARLNGRWGMVDMYGNEVIPFMFEDVSLCIDGTAFAVSGGKVYRFDISESVKGMLGDVNNDEKIDVEDAVKIINHINGVTPLTEDQTARADVDHNSVIDIQDAVKVINHVNGVSAIVQP